MNMKLKYVINIEIEFTGEDEVEVKQALDVAKEQDLNINDLFVAAINEELEDFREENNIVKYEVSCTVEGYDPK